MRISSTCRSLGLLAGASFVLFTTRAARASNVTEFPDNGSEQMARGGAWVARASDPLATFYNPAGLAGQDTRLLLDANLNFQKTCMTRVKSAQDLSVDQGVRAGGTFPQVCSDGAMFPNPQLAFAWRVSPRVGLGFAVLGPSASGAQNWPTDVGTPQRYLLLSANALLLTPTIGVGWEVLDDLRIGASVQWGVANLKLSNRSIAFNGDNLSAKDNDVDAELTAKQMFVPGFTLGTIWSATPSFDVAAWYRWSAPINAKGDVTTNYHGTTGDTSVSDCGTNQANEANVCGSGNNATVKLAIPMEAKLGLRFHKLRAGGEPTLHRRDPLDQDVFDLEADLTWANNSAIDNLEIRFPGGPDGNGTIPVNGTGGQLPPNADVRHHYKDVLGVRVGGDYNVIPAVLALRGGAFFESNAQDTTYQNIDFAGAQRIGVALGGTVRLARKLEVSLGYAHVFVADQKNDDPNANGVAGLAGTPCNPSAVQNGDFCPDGRLKYRTNWPVNLGTITNAVNMINVGLAYRF